jgi:hypothetical protein
MTSAPSTLIATAIASLNPDFELYPEDVLAEHEPAFARIAAAVLDAGFVRRPGTTVSFAGRQLLIDAICSVDQDFEDYPDYVKDGYRTQMTGMADAIIAHGFALPVAGEND